MKTRTSASSVIAAMVTGHRPHHSLRCLFALALLVLSLIGQALLPAITMAYFWPRYTMSKVIGIQPSSC
jgi:hypothetical protein